MHSFSVYALFAAAAANLALAAAPDPVALAIVKQQFTNAHIVPDGLPSFDPSALLTVDFKPSVGVITVGQQLAKNDSTFQPNITVQTTSNSTGAKYTFMMVDFNYAGSSNPGGYYLHWLSNDNTLGSNGTLTPPADTIEPYGGPAPPSGSGPHRYTLLLFAQPSNFTVPSSPKPHSGVQLFNFTQYVTSTYLGTPIGGSYFTVEVGAATVSVLSTTGVDTKTFTITSTASSTGSGSATKPTSTSSQGAADKTTTASFIGALSSFLFAVFMTM